MGERRSGLKIDSGKRRVKFIRLGERTKRMKNELEKARFCEEKNMGIELEDLSNGGAENEEMEEEEG